ncbi:MAG: SPFH domain-containing protein [Arenicellales bacterium]|jgi:uncharacterized membrane protein YqiK|nr:hypothetical protein [Acidiferrobacteraceae bacterium]MDP6135162.1 SPFH domain-containing protein [Arenicellales bacterium]HCF73109.1 hypothetical protein [Gammaproteobacteria bacterium]MDP6392651.1 SPFH domain-containing protein [Arenicellales bacterium]MDP7219402.1 SPFH domain-containing protein [Arenicellales bacterium]|tara:strand:- start:5372 stop:7936 length:2565 start_codon:yes stop_codon:yes gene_type:complete
MSIETLITLVILAVIAVAIFYIISVWVYKRAPANMGFIRTGFGGTRVCLGQGAMVLPVFHEVSWVSLETIKLIVSRSRDQAILTSDKIRVDVVAELYTHVGYTEDDLLTASRSLGEKTFDADNVRNLLEAKIISALRSYAATKTLNELHENRDTFAKDIKSQVRDSFQANGLNLEEVTIVTMEQTGKEYFKADNVFDAEGLKIITAITSKAKREVHDTEKKASVAIRQKELDTQLELLEIERQEAFAKANQDKAVSNEQALRVGEKQRYVLEQKMAVEQKEIENEQTLEQLRTDRDVAIIEEARKREVAEIEKTRVTEQERRDREIHLISKAKEEELANIQRNLDLEKAEKDRQIELHGKSKEEQLAQIQREQALEIAEKDKQIQSIVNDRQRQEAEILRQTAITTSEEQAREERAKASEVAEVAIQQQKLASRLSLLDVDKNDAFATAAQEKDIAEEQARILTQKQLFLLEQKWQVEQEEIHKELSVEQAQIDKEAQVLLDSQKKETAEVQRSLARQSEERNREIALAAKEMELEQAEARRLEATAARQKAEHQAESVRHVADAERQRIIDLIEAENSAETRRVEEENKAQISRMHMLAQAEARKESAQREADATLTRARASSEAQQINALGIEKEAAAKGRAEMEVEQLRVDNTQRMLEAEASGIEAKADALKKYNLAATFLELSKMQIEAERDVRSDQAKAMGNALQGAQIRMYGGSDDGTIDNIRSLFTSGFGVGEALEGLAQSMPEGLRQRFAENGIRGLFGAPGGAGRFQHAVTEIGELLTQTLKTKKSREETDFRNAMLQLEEAAGSDKSKLEAVSLLTDFNQAGVFDEVPFETVWSLLLATSKSVN